MQLSRRSRYPLGLRRLGGFFLDYLFIVLYAVTLFGLTMLVSPSEALVEGSFDSKWKGHLIAFSTLTLPVRFYFSFFESSKSQATPGKRILGVKVVSPSKRRVLFARAGLRNAIKFLPWEIAHIAIWYVPQRPFLDRMPIVNLVVCVLAQVLALVLTGSLFFGSRAIYDRLAGTDVVRK